MWQVRLIGARDSVERLAGAYARSDVKVCVDGEGGFLTAVELERLNEPQAVVNRADELVKKICGILSLDADFEPVTIGSLNRIEGDRKHAFAIGAELRPATATLAGSGTVHDSTGTLKQDEEDRIFQLRALAETDLVIADFLSRHASHSRDWAGLFKLYEVIRNDVGGEQLLYDRHWISRAERVLFTQTADNSHAIGHAARHAASKTAPPRTPMSLDEAKKLVRRLGSSWLTYKLAQTKLKPEGT